MSLEEQGCTNVLLLSTRYNMIKVLETGSAVESYSNNTSKYHLNVSTNETKSELQICLFIKTNTTLRDTNRWIQLEELKEDYANLEPIYLTHAKTGRVYRTV